METQNPYRTPSPIEAKSEPAPTSHEDGAIGLEFESDWSTAGIKLRRRNPMHAPADLAVALLSVLWICLLVLSPASQRAAGLTCLLTPIWLCAGGLWLTNLGFRSAASFAKTCRGLCGPVCGRVEQGFVSVSGPAVCLATRVDDCSQSSWATEGGTVFRPPMITELLPVIESDIQRTWQSDSEPASEADHHQLLNRLPGISATDATGNSTTSEDADQVFVTGQLRGGDLRGQSVWRRWLVLGTTLTTLGAVGLAVGTYKWVNLPPWILDPPSHYIPSTSDRNAISVLVVIFLLSALALVLGLFLWSRTRASFGQYAVAITPSMVALGSEQVALGYHGEALRHFAWTDRGVTVRLVSGKVIFVLPARWFDISDRQKLASWLGLGDQPQRVKANYYVGPKV